MNGRSSRSYDVTEHDDDEQGQFTNSNIETPTLEMLELELAETEELLAEAVADNGNVVHSYSQTLSKRRNAKQPAETTTSQSSALQNWIGLIRSHVGHTLGLRNFAVLCVLSAFVGSLVHTLDWSLWSTVPQHVVVKSPHATSLGGTQNPGHFDTSSRSDADNDDEELDDRIFNQHYPKDNAGSAVYSCSSENLQNLNGHFWHDPIKSPFASRLYKSNLNTTAADDQQSRFNQALKAAKDQYGAWTQPDFTGLTRPSNFHTVPHKDLNGSAFPANAWQSDKTYVDKFLKEAQALVRRVQKAIYKEYGYDEYSERFAVLKIDQHKAHDFVTMLSGVATAVDIEGNPHKGIAFLRADAQEGLVRKLLHAMMTHDEFYVVAVGGEHLYQGHNLWRTQVMQFQQIMEPVFDKLGMQLISRNMGMEASTTISALGGADVYGEADIFWYIPDSRRDNATVESDGQMDLLQRQAILAGERVPIILTPNPGEIAEQGEAWIGNLQPGIEICAATALDSGVVSLPDIPTCEYVQCTREVIVAGLCKDFKSHCWVERSDWNPSPTDAQQLNDTGYQEQGFANDRQHQLDGRKLALLVLNGLEEALARWVSETAIALPLADDIWHVGPTYHAVRESVRTLERRPGTAATVPSCEVFLQSIDPMICHMAMHVYTEWTPRINPDFNRLFHAITDARSVLDNTADLTELYIGVDMLPLAWQVNTSDAHMVAIATNEELDVYDTDDFQLSDDIDHRNDGDDDDHYADSDDATAHRRLAAAPRLTVATDRWTLFDIPLGFCDGSSQSFCNRRIGNSCLLSNHNHFRPGIVGHGNAGWLNLTLPITEGVILLRFDWNLDAATNVFDLQSNHLDLLPVDFHFDYSIDERITTMSVDQFKSLGVKLADDLIVHPVLIDRAMSSAEGLDKKIQLGMRIRTSSGQRCKVVLSHVYFA
jgi:hypothetical protein